MRFIPFITIFLLAYIEILLFVKVASVLGVFLTLLLVIFTSCLGVVLIRNKGVKNLIQIQQKIDRGESPAVEMISSVSLFLSGVLFFIPGFFTDFLALLLLLPPVQHLITIKILPYIRFQTFGQKHAGREQGKTIEGDFYRHQDDDKLDK